MDREKEITDSYSYIPEAEIEEGSEYIMYDSWDRIKEWLERKIK